MSGTPKIENRPHQRKGAKSNAQVGSAFERVAQGCLARSGIMVTPNFPIPLGIEGRSPKSHHFDFGAAEPPILVECKSHRWTEGDKVPSAKMTTWNEAMFYFSLAPARYRRILFVLRHLRKSSGESLVAYYLRTHGHLIPAGVEIWEYCESSGSHEIHII